MLPRDRTCHGVSALRDYRFAKSLRTHAQRVRQCVPGTAKGRLPQLELETKLDLRRSKLCQPTRNAPGISRKQACWRLVTGTDVFSDAYRSCRWSKQGATKTRTVRDDPLCFCDVLVFTVHFSRYLRPSPRGSAPLPGGEGGSGPPGWLKSNGNWGS